MEDPILQQQFEEMMGLYDSIKVQVRQMDPHLFERWKAGGYLVDPDIMSMYPHLGQVVESLTEGEEEDDEHEAQEEA